jgi:hypothetical protein
MERVEQNGEQRRPYAAAANITAVVERARRINLPERINADFLEIVGIPEVARGRVLDALRFLRFIDEIGRPTDVLRALAGAPDDEVQDLLAAALRDAYAEDFNRVNPSQDPQARIVAAFRRYQPRSQTDRMVMLFLGLCRAAGIPVLDAPRERQMQGAARPRPVARREPTRAEPTRSVGPAEPRDRGQSDSGFGKSLSFDLADLDLIESDEDFDAVWAALGKAQRLVGKAKRRREPALGGPTEETAEEE